MRTIELTWDTAHWAPGIAEQIVAALLHGLGSPHNARYAWVEPDAVRVLRKGDLVYPDGQVRIPELPEAM